MQVFSRPLCSPLHGRPRRKALIGRLSPRLISPRLISPRLISRCLGLAAALVLGASLPARAEELAFVLDSAEAAISLVDVKTEREVSRIPVLREPHHMALSPDHRELLVGDSAGNEIFFLDPVSGALKRRLSITDPYQLQFSPDGHLLVVTGLARNQVDIYEAGTYRLLYRVPISAMPSHINFSPDSRVTYITLQQTNRLAAIDTASGRVIWEMPVGDTPAGVLWLRGRLLVGVMGADGVAVIDPATGRLLERVHTGRGAHNLFLTPDGKTVIVTNRVDGTLAFLDAATLTVRREIRLPGGPDDLDFAPDGRIWITRRFAHSVAVLDPESGDYQVIKVGRSPHGIWLNTHDALARAVGRAE